MRGRKVDFRPIMGAQSVPKGETPTPSGATPEEVETLKRSLDDARRRGEDLERLILSPDYVEYIATRGSRDKEESRKPSAPAEEEIDFEAMSNKQLVTFVINSIRQTLTSELPKIVAPLRAESASTEVRRQIDKCAADHKDYWLYKEEMIAIANAHPSMSAEDTYLLAKQKFGPREAKVPPKTEIPSNASSATKPPPKGAAGAAAAAWDLVIGKGKETIT